LGTICFGGAYFHKIKGTDTLSRSHNNLNTTDDNVGLRTSLHLLGCAMCVRELKIFCFRDFFGFLKILLLLLLFLTAFGQNHVQSTRGLDLDHMIK
jgi:hypothetical protein